MENNDNGVINVVYVERREEPVTPKWRTWMHNHKDEIRMLPYFSISAALTFYGLKKVFD